MKKSIILFILAGLILGCGNAENKVDPFEQNKLLKRTINLGNYLEAPSLGAWGVMMEDEDYPLIRQAGFTAVRIPVRWSAHADTVAPFTIDPGFFELVDRAVDNALKNNLAVVLNMHHYEEIFQEPAAHEERFLALWKQIAEHYRDLPDQVIFELLNEPHHNLDAAAWEKLFNKAIPVVRASNPDRTLMIGPDHWNNVNALESLNLPQNDQNIIATFHYYLPFHFTHQGASWVEGSDEWLGETWTGTEEQKAAVLADLDKAVKWAKENNRPLFVGEFGAYSKADMDSRIAWTSFVARSCEERGISWAYWEFCSGFGVYDRGNSQWRKPLLKALIPE